MLRMDSEWGQIFCQIFKIEFASFKMHFLHWMIFNDQDLHWFQEAGLDIGDKISSIFSTDLGKP